MAKAEDVLKKITMINNIKYIKDNNNNNNTSIVSKESNEEEVLTSSFCLAEPVKPLGEALASYGTLPMALDLPVVPILIHQKVMYSEVEIKDREPKVIGD